MVAASVHVEAEVTHRSLLEPAFAARVLVEVLPDVAGACRAGHRRLERGDLLTEPVTGDLVDTQVFELLGLHLGAATQRPQVPEDLPGVDLLRRAAAIFALAANNSTAWNAHHDCDTAIAYGARAGDHASSWSSLITPMIRHHRHSGPHPIPLLAWGQLRDAVTGLEPSPDRPGTWLAGEGRRIRRLLGDTG